GGRAARAVRAMLNVPLRLFGRPQTYFNHEVRRVLASWAGVLQTRLDLQVTLERRIAMHMNRIERLAQRETQLEHAVVALRRLLDARDPPGARPPGAPPISSAVRATPSLVFDHPTGSRNHVELRANSGAHLRLAIDPATPPFGADSVAEVVVRH